MFKKDISLQSQTRLKNSAVKALRKDLLKRYPLLTEAQCAEVFPNKAAVTKAKTTHKTLLWWVDEGPPLLFDPDGRGDRIFPSVYMLWRLPSMLQPLLIAYQVSKYVLGGADPMLPGVDTRTMTTLGVSQLRVGQVRSVMCTGNPMPIAVGEVCVSLDQEQMAGASLKGRALVVKHHFIDALWRYGDESVPNQGFFKNGVVPTESGVDTEAQATHEDVPEGEVETETDIEPQVDGEAGGEAGEAGGEAGGEADGEAEEEVSEPDIPPERMATVLTESLLFAIKTSLVDEALPVEASELLSKHMFNCHPHPFRLSVKLSPFKKTGKFLKEMQKQGVLNTKTVNGVLTVVSVDRNHPSVVTFVVTKKMLKDARSCRKLLLGSSTSPTSSSSSRIRVITAYRPSSRLASLFPQVPKGTTFTLAETWTILWDYVKREGLDRGANIAVDPVLAHTLLHASGVATATISKKYASTRWMSGLELMYAVCREGDEVLAYKRGPVPRLCIGVEVRSGRQKTVTKITGLETFLIDPTEVAKTARKKFASSTTVTPVAQGKRKPSVDEVLIQGNIAQEVKAFLIANYGIPAQYFRISGKKSKQKKK